MVNVNYKRHNQGLRAHTRRKDTSGYWLPKWARENKMLSNNIKQAAEEIFIEEGSEAVNQFLRAKGASEEDVKDYFRSYEQITVKEAFDKVYKEKREEGIKGWFERLFK